MEPVMTRLLAALACLTSSVAFAGGIQSSTLVLDDASCVAISGNTVVRETCSDSLTQQWIAGDDGRFMNVRRYVVSGAERCIAGADDGSFTTADCDTADDNQVFIQIQSDAGTEYLNKGTTGWLQSDTVSEAASEGAQWELIGGDDPAI